jgi:hypothetical protein
VTDEEERILREYFESDAQRIESEFEEIRKAGAVISVYDELVKREMYK